MRLFVTSIIVLLGMTSLQAQLGGESTYQFLNLISSPRQAALGGKVLTNVDYDVTQALYNPATINLDMDNQLSFNYSNYLGDIRYGTAAYAYTIDRRTQTFHVGMTYINYGSFDGYDENGSNTGTFTGNEAALSVGYATQIGYSDFHVGANLKLITSKLEQYSSFGIATDIGIIYIDPNLEFNAALVIRNFGTQLTTYAGMKESLPFEIDLGKIEERIPKIRDSIGELFVPGRVPGSYMITERAYLPYYYKTKVNSMDAILTKGTWEVQNDFMAGPYINYIIKDSINKRNIVIEGFSFAPSESKRNYMFELNTIITTMKLVN